MATAEDRVGMGPDGAPETCMPFTVRPAGLDDVDDVAAIEALAFTNPWHAHSFRSLLERKQARILVAEGCSGEILGYAVAWWVQDQAELANLAVKEEHRGRGIGSALLDRILADLRENEVDSLFLEVRVSNEGALNLYRSRGFVQVALRKDYYQKPREDARILLKELRARKHL